MNLKHTTKPKYTLDIIIEFTEEYHKIAAANFVHHPKNVKRKLLYSDEQLERFDYLIQNVMNIIAAHKFDITDHYQSKRSYAYYIDFFPTDENGDRWEECIRIRVRIADHAEKGSYKEDRPKIEPRPEEGFTILVSFKIGSERYSNEVVLIREIRTMCDHLQKGDYDILGKYI